MTLTLDPTSTLPTDSTSGTLVGRVWRPDVAGPSVVAIRRDGVFDISRSFPTMRDLCESADPAIIYQTKVGGIGPFVDFLTKVGTLKNPPASWRDMFFPEALAAAGG